MAIYSELLDLGVGDPGSEGWNLSEAPDEAIEEALEWMDGKIRLARAPYGNSVIVVKVAPVNAALNEVLWEQGKPIPPFPKRDWPKMRDQIAARMRQAANVSPVGVVVTGIFSFGDVLLRSLTDYKRTYVKNSRGS